MGLRRRWRPEPWGGSIAEPKQDVQPQRRKPEPHIVTQILIGISIIMMLVAGLVALSGLSQVWGSYVPLLVAALSLVIVLIRLRRSVLVDATLQQCIREDISHRQPGKKATQMIPQATPASPQLNCTAKSATIAPMLPVPALVGDRLVRGDVQLLAASRIGRRHIAGGIAREDCYAIRDLPEGVVAVVADGVGSTRGAQAASDLVCRFMAYLPWDLTDTSSWQGQVGARIKELEITLLQEVGGPEVGASTMVFVLLQPGEEPNRYRLWWAALGDSELLVVSATDSLQRLNREPGLKRDGTSALPGHAAQVEAGWVDLDMTGRQVLLTTDGFAEPFHRDPASSMRDLNSAVSAGDPAYLLAAIRQTGSAYHDDATAVLFAGRRA